MLSLIKGWLGLGKKNAKGKNAAVYAPMYGKVDNVQIRPAGGGMDANVVPSAGLEWMDEKNQK